MSKKRMVLGVIVVVIFIGGVAYFRGFDSKSINAAKDKGSAAEVTSNKIAVKVVTPKEGALGDGLYYKATLEADQEGIVSSKNSGKVIDVLFDDGKQVNQGAPLVQLDDQDIKNQIKTAESQLEVSKAALLKTEANLENSQRSYDRVKTLVEQGAAAQVELENADTSLKIVKADEASCQAAIQAAQTTIDNLNTTLADMVVRAPISGVMDGKNVSIGQFLAPGSVLGKVKNIALIDAGIEVDQDLIQNITIGQKATVKLNENDTAYEGVVKSITPSADPTSRAFKVKVQLNNVDLSLRPGVFAKVILAGEVKTQSFMIPVSLILGNQGNYYVYINNNGIVKKQTVTVGNLANDQAEIKTGLKGNEAIISTNLNMLQEGDEITVVSE